MRRAILLLLLVLALGGSLAACGKKGPLEPPPDKEQSEKRA
jgi:predicted small lipoprotein YifL